MCDAPPGRSNPVEYNCVLASRESVLLLHLGWTSERMPLTVSRVCLYMMQEGASVVLDPELREEAAAAGTMTIIINTNSDICAIKKTCGIGTPVLQVCAKHVHVCADCSLQCFV